MSALFMNKDTRNGGAGKTELNFTPLVVPTNRIFNVKIIIEKSICVVYINDNIAFTNRIYKMDQNPWTIFADQGTVKVNQLKIEKS